MSVSRQCYFRLAADQQWYMQLGNHEYAWDDWDCTWYGPFKSYEDADQFLRDHFSSTSGAEIENSGKSAPPDSFTDPSTY